MKKRMTSLIMAVLMILSVVFASPAGAASPSCISDIRIETGNDAVEKLEKDGYTVIFRNLNPSSRSAEKIYLGYKLGDNALTGIIVSSSYKSSLNVNGATYKPVSDTDLNYQTGGTPLYLYSTRDGAAGSGIIALTSVQKDKRNDVDLMSYFGDGSVPVRKDDGKAADFEEGIDKCSLYFFAVHEKLCLPYIKELRTVTVNEGEDTFGKIVSLGCDYFSKSPIKGPNGEKTYICYNRTDDASSAVRCVIVSDTEPCEYGFISAGKYITSGGDHKIRYTKSMDAGNPINDITVGKIMNDRFTLGEWALSCFGGEPTSARSRLLASDEFAVFSSSEDACIQPPVKEYRDSDEIGDTGLYTVTAEKNYKQISVSDLFEDEHSDTIQPDTSDTSSEEVSTDDVSDTAVESDTEFTEDSAEDNTDEVGIPESSDETEDVFAEDGFLHDTADSEYDDALFAESDGLGEGENSASAIGLGSVIAVSALAIAAAAFAVAFAVTNRKKAKSENEKSGKKEEAAAESKDSDENGDNGEGREE